MNFPTKAHAHCVAVARALVLDVCIFARFKVNCEFVLLRSLANFKFVMSRHGKKLRGALGHGLCENRSLATILTSLYFGTLIQCNRNLVKNSSGDKKYNVIALFLAEYKKYVLLSY